MAGTASLSLLTWNIYGLQPRYLQERTEYICEYIITHSPSVVYLQEVVASTWPIIKDKMGSQYHCFCGSPKIHYFNALLVRKSPDIELISEKEDILEFPTSGMGRYLIDVSTRCHGVKIRFMTTHIESLGANHNVIERKKQLGMVFARMIDYFKNDSAASVFGGDMNAKDTEIKDIGLPEPIVDVWERCGSERNQKMTWNTDCPVARYDRVYLCPRQSGSQVALQAAGFQLIGGERMDRLRCYPSDHLGIWVNFSINNE